MLRNEPKSSRKWRDFGIDLDTAGWRIGHTRTEHHVWAPTVVVLDPKSQGTPQMGFREGNEPVQTLATSGADAQSRRELWHAGTPTSCPARGRSLHRSAKATTNTPNVDRCEPCACYRPCSRRARPLDQRHRAPSNLHSTAHRLTRAQLLSRFPPLGVLRRLPVKPCLDRMRQPAGQPSDNA